ncbi:restriction endonuclease subunit S [Flavobacterium hibernum]|nr:restriction endonuclease subunit S [Flavobacterium hibernum]
MSNSNLYLHFIDFVKLSEWSVQGLLHSNFNYTNKFELAKIGDFLLKSRDTISIEDNIDYKRITVKINNNGVILRDIEKGVNIGTKKQFKVKKGQFILSKIDARNGAFGIIPDNLDGAIVTNDFPIFNIDSSRINPHFLLLITTTQAFINFAQSCSSGTTNRQRINVEIFLNQFIPLPSTIEQQKIVNNYQDKIKLAEDLEKQAEDLDQEIEKYFLEQLDLNQLNERLETKGLLLIDFKDVERWDYFSGDYGVNIQLKKSKYPLIKIGEKYSFEKRSFNKKAYQYESFKYIEIGAIDAIKGITEIKDVKVSKAPSRATQFVKTGDLIIGTTRPYLKKFAIVTKENNDNVCSSGFSVISKSDDYYLPFLLQFLRCSYGVEQLRNRMTGGLYPAITESELKEIKIPFPNFTEQKIIMELVNQKETEILNNKNIIQSLINQATEEFEQAIFYQI